MIFTRFVKSIVLLSFSLFLSSGLLCQYTLPEINTNNIKTSVEVLYTLKGEEIERDSKEFDKNGRILKYEFASPEGGNTRRIFFYPDEYTHQEIFLKVDGATIVDTIYSILREASRKFPDNYGIDISYSHQKYQDFYEGMWMEPTKTLPFDSTVFNINTFFTSSYVYDRMSRRMEYNTEKRNMKIDFIYYWNEIRKGYQLRKLLFIYDTPDGLEREILYSYHVLLSPDIISAEYSKVYNKQGDIQRVDNIFTTVNIPTTYFRYTDFDEHENWIRCELYQNRKKINYIERELSYH